MSPTVRSRLAAAATAFLLGFVLANYGILRVVGPDRALWLTLAVILMVTGAVGVIISDSPRRVSVWSVVGLEFMIVFTLAPLLWMFTIAAAPDLGTPTSMLPQRFEWSGFREALGDANLRGALLNSLLVSFVATLISLAIAVPAAQSLTRERTRLASRI